jgi:predicted unusual protein kinase regulating ubiquinone biosynthesis (AarF/ABC1/UbiB family)
MTEVQQRTAEQLFRTLGDLKGGAMKMGQALSILESALPEEVAAPYRQQLTRLQDSAPPMSATTVHHVLAQELGTRWRRQLIEFDDNPAAAASIGQVHRGRWADGRDVAVKVQYPGVNIAVRSDLANLGMILRLMKSVAPGLDPKAMGAEIRSRIEEELDYELEAQNQRKLSRVFRGHPFVMIPDVVTSLSHERVIVSEFVAGRGFEEMKQLPQADRDRIGEIVFRFYFGCMYRHHQFSGDPHPGNMMLRDDGTMAFLDFGLFKQISAEAAEFELQSQRLGIARKGAELKEHLHRGGWMADPTQYTDEGILEQFDDLTWWYSRDEVIELTPEIATEVMIQMGDPRSDHFGKMRHETLPPEHLFGRRLEMLTLAVIGQLRAKANWHRIAREWIFGDEPVTELGRAEAEFLADRA